MHALNLLLDTLQRVELRMCPAQILYYSKVDPSVYAACERLGYLIQWLLLHTR